MRNLVLLDANKGINTPASQPAYLCSLVSALNWYLISGKLQNFYIRNIQVSLGSLVG